MSKLPIVGPSSKQRSVMFNHERAINLFPLIDQDGTEKTAYYGTPGLDLFGAVGTGPGRASFTSAADGRLFVVSGSILYEVFADGTSVNRGSLNSSSGVVQMDENGVQLGICDGQYLYMFTYATNAFTQVTDADLPSVCGTLTFVGGYFIVNQVGTGKFYISDLYNGLSWQALRFATAESSPDNLVCVINILGQLWLMGSLTTEVWNNNGAVAFPFSKISGSEMQTGVYAPTAVVAADNTAVWIGRSKEGSRIVYRAVGFTPQRISTEAIELLLNDITSPDTVRILTYQEEGHTFLMITGGGMKTSPTYDFSTKVWHERSYLNQYGDYEVHRGSSNTVAFNKQLVTDRVNGNIYRMALGIYSDNGDAMASDRIFTTLGEEGQPFRSSNLTIFCETGVGTQTGQGVDPKMQLSLSNDGGQSWFGHQFSSIGRVGNALLRGCTFHRLGTARHRTFRIRITDPVKRAIMGAYFNVPR